MKPYTFYDGPPFATGLPHYGHICAGTIKVVLCVCSVRMLCADTSLRRVTTCNVDSAGTVMVCQSSSRSIRCLASSTRMMSTRFSIVIDFLDGNRLVQCLVSQHCDEVCQWMAHHNWSMWALDWFRERLQDTRSEVHGECLVGLQADLE